MNVAMKWTVRPLTNILMGCCICSISAMKKRKDKAKRCKVGTFRVKKIHATVKHTHTDTGEHITDIYN